MICLLKLSLANFDDVCKVFSHVFQKAASNGTFTGEQAIQWVGVSRLFRQRAELLDKGVIVRKEMSK